MRYLITISCIFLLAAAAAARAGAPARIGEAEVREASNGGPCFTISEREERRGGVPDFRSLTVFGASNKPNAKMWSMTMPRERTFGVTFSMCIPYGGRLRSLPQTHAAELEPGRVYQVYIDARVPNAPNSPRGYMARFCLIREHGGGTVVHHIDADAREGRYHYGCTAPRV